MSPRGGDPPFAQAPGHPCSRAVGTEPCPAPASSRSARSLLRQPRSAPGARQPRLTPTASRAPPRTPTAAAVGCRGAGDRRRAGAPSIFGAGGFGRWVVTHSLADADFHGHRPTVQIRQRPSGIENEPGASAPHARQRFTPHRPLRLPKEAHLARAPTPGRRPVGRDGRMPRVQSLRIGRRP